MIHVTSDAAVHAHSAGVVTLTEPEPPAASRDVWGAVNETSHLTGDGPVDTFDDEPHAAAPTAADVTSTSSVFNAFSGLTGTPLSNFEASRFVPDFRHYRPFSEPGNRWVKWNFAVVAYSRGTRQHPKAAPAKSAPGRGPGCSLGAGDFSAWGIARSATPKSDALSFGGHQLGTTEIVAVDPDLEPDELLKDFGGRHEARTRDLRVANAALSQLS